MQLKYMNSTIDEIKPLFNLFMYFILPHYQLIAFSCTHNFTKPSRHRTCIDWAPLHLHDNDHKIKSNSQQSLTFDLFYCSNQSKFQALAIALIDSLAFTEWHLLFATALVISFMSASATDALFKNRLAFHLACVCHFSEALNHQ